MESDRLFTLQVVIAIQDQWYSPENKNHASRTEVSYRIDEQMFSASDEDEAYQKANGWLNAEAYSDSHHNGKGERTVVCGIGIHQLEELPDYQSLLDIAKSEYGVELPGFDQTAVDENGAPIIRKMEELEVFRLRELRKT